MHFLNNPFFSLVLVNRWRVLNHRWSTEIPFRISLTSQILMFLYRGFGSMVRESDLELEGS